MKKQNDNNVNDIFKIINGLKDIPSENISNFKKSIKTPLMRNDKISENIIADIFYSLKIKVRQKIDNEIWKYLINRKQKFYYNLVDKMDIFDMTSLDDVFRNYPGFKIESLYLAGGMDKSVDIGAGWRLVIENEFEKYVGKSIGLPDIDLGPFGKIEPKRVVDGIYLDEFLKNSKKIIKLYNKPLILNPVRKEVDRTKDKKFLNGAITYKTFNHETNVNDFEPTFTDIRRTMSKSIEVDDEHLVRLSDFVILGLNQAASAGTYGELQTQSHMNKPIFTWMTDKDWKLGQTEKDPFGGFSFWTLPHITKFARSEEDMKTLIKTIIRYIK